MCLKPGSAVVKRHTDVQYSSRTRIAKGRKRRGTHVENPDRIYLHDRLETLEGEQKRRRGKRHAQRTTTCIFVVSRLEDLFHEPVPVAASPLDQSKKAVKEAVLRD